MKKVFVVILNWNQAELTLECVESVNKINRKGFSLRIMVVDNASDDDSAAVLRKKLPKKNTHLLINEKNKGFAGGNNTGVAHALAKKADYIMILNNDTEVDKNLVVNFLKEFEKHESAGILTPKIYFAKGYEFQKDYKNSDLGHVIWYAGGEMDWNNVMGKNRGVDEVDVGQYDKAERVDFATGTCLFVKAEVLRKIGLFNESYFMYFEDVEFSIRVKEVGFEIYYVPKARLWHKVAQSSAIGSGLNDYFIARNRLLFGMKYAPMKIRLFLLRHLVILLMYGRRWERRGVIDYILGRFGKGSWK